MIKDVNTILIFKLCCFGDVVFITPAVKSLRKSFPDAKIVYAYSEWIEPMMEHIPCIDDKILFENVYSPEILKKSFGALKFITYARKQKFDLVLFGHRSNALSMVLKLSGIPYRLGFKGTSYLTHTAEFDESIPEHIRYLNILSKNGIKAEIKSPELVKPPCNDKRKQLGFNTDDVILGIFPFGGMNPGTLMRIKKWNLLNYAKLAEMLNTKYPHLKILFFEGNENEKLNIPDHISAKKSNVSIDSISCCNYFLSSDTGSLHIAAAMGIPTLSLFGPTDPRLVSPAYTYENRHIHRTIWKQHICSPCYTPSTAIDRTDRKYWNENEFICHAGNNACMQAISTVEVLNELESMLNILR